MENMTSALKRTVKQMNQKNKIKNWDKYSFAEYFKTGLSSQEVKRRGIKPYIFHARIGREGKEIKEYFKTKKEANERLKKYFNIMESD